MLRTSSSRRSLASAGRRAIAGATDPQYGLSACTDNETHLDAIVDAVRDVSGVEVVHVCARGRSPVVRRVANQEVALCGSEEVEQARGELFGLLLGDVVAAVDRCGAHVRRPCLPDLVDVCPVVEIGIVLQ